MEGSAYTTRTLEFFEKRLYPKYPDNVGIVLQSSLTPHAGPTSSARSRSAAACGCARARISKPATVAFPDKVDVDRNYVTLHAGADGARPLSGNRDARSGDHRARQGDTRLRHGIDRSRFEFQMLYGVRRDLQEQLAREGYRMRVYVPFGTQWYPYLMRRLAERPANLAFITGSIAKEFVSRRKRSGTGSA